jgi:superoxide dismutase, Cu-Zn family
MTRLSTPLLATPLLATPLLATRLLAGSFLSVLLFCAPAEAALKAKAIARLSGLDGKPLGTATFDALNHGVLITFDLHDLAPGPHAIHLHTSGNCNAQSGFTSAGPILSLVPGKPHGYLAEGGPAAGDLPNQFAGADGRLHASVETGSFSLGNGKKSIFDRDGVAVIVDARGDDYRTQPLGNAGDRIACGVVMRTRGPAPRPYFPPKKP